MKLTAFRLITAHRGLFTVKKLQIRDYMRYRAIRKIINTLDEEYLIYQEKEQELVARYASLDADGKPNIIGNIINFDTAIQKRDYDIAINEINNEIIDIDITPITITENEAAVMGLTYEEIEALEGIVNIAWIEEKNR